MWAQMINALIGLAIMVSPDVLQFMQTETNNNYILGPLIITFAVISFWECNRNARLFNIVTGAWLIIAPFIFGFRSDALWLDVIGGVLLILLSLVKGKMTQKFGGGWRSLFMDNASHIQSK